MYPSKHGRLMGAAHRALQAEMDRQRNDEIVGRKRPRYNDTPPTSPARSSVPDLIRRPSLGGQRGQSGQGGRSGRTGRDRPQQTRRRNYDRELDDILNGLRMPEHVLDRLEIRWMDLKMEAAKEARDARTAKENEEVVRSLANTRGQEIHQRRLEIHDLRASSGRLDRETMRLREEVDKQAAMLKTLKAKRSTKAEDSQMIKDLKKENLKLQEQHEIDSNLLKFNTKVQEQKKMEKENMARELASLREMVDAKDRAISTMDSHVRAMASASPDDAIRLALETQAQRTLSMVQGLRKDVANRDDALEQLQGLLTATQAHDEQNEALKAAEKRAVNAEHRLAEMQATADQQQGIIDKLVKQSRDNFKMSFY